MTYSWLTELISVGYSKATKGDKKGLQAEDVKNVKARDKTSNRFAEFEENWNSEIARVQAINAKKKPKPQKKKNKVSDESEENKKARVQIKKCQKNVRNDLTKVENVRNGPEKV